MYLEPLIRGRFGIYSFASFHFGMEPRQAFGDDRSLDGDTYQHFTPVAGKVTTAE